MGMRFDFSGRSVVVTGAAAGIGLAVARSFAASGGRVWVLDVDAAAATAAAEDLPGATGLGCDVSDPAQVDAAVASVVEAHGAVDVLVNNAGVLRDRVVWKLTDEQWSDVLSVHLSGTFHCTRAVVPSMRAQGRGRIVNVTSYTGLHGNLGQAAYAAAKAGVIGFTKTTAKELAPFGITVNAVSPNAETAMVASIPEDHRRHLLSLIPAGRFGTPEEMAPAFGFLASDEAAYVTGVVLPVDGGLSM